MDNNVSKKPTYKVIKKIGEGAFGKAYLAESPVNKVSELNKLESMCNQNYIYRSNER